MKPDRALCSGLPGREILASVASTLTGDVALGLSEIVEIAVERHLCARGESAQAVSRSLSPLLGTLLKDASDRAFRVFHRRSNIRRFYEFVFENAELQEAAK